MAVDCFSEQPSPHNTITKQFQNTKKHSHKILFKKMGRGGLKCLRYPFLCSLHPFLPPSLPPNLPPSLPSSLHTSRPPQGCRDIPRYKVNLLCSRLPIWCVCVYVYVCVVCVCVCCVLCVVCVCVCVCNRSWPCPPESSPRWSLRLVAKMSARYCH